MSKLLDQESKKLNAGITIKPRPKGGFTVAYAKTGLRAYAATEADARKIRDAWGNRRRNNPFGW